MTIREWAVDYWVQLGMPPTAANAVVERVESEAEQMKGRWGDIVDDNPKNLLVLLTLFNDKAAVASIEANKPLA